MHTFDHITVNTTAQCTLRSGMGPVLNGKSSGGDSSKLAGGAGAGDL